jgi:hypothetical protein
MMKEVFAGTMSSRQSHCSARRELFFPLRGLVSCETGVHQKGSRVDTLSQAKRSRMVCVQIFILLRWSQVPCRPLPVLPGVVHPPSTPSGVLRPKPLWGKAWSPICFFFFNMSSKSPAQRIPIALRRGLIRNFIDCVDRTCARILHLVRHDVEPSMYLLFTCRAFPVCGCGSAVPHDLAPMRTRQKHVSSVNRNISSLKYFKPVERSASLHIDLVADADRINHIPRNVALDAEAPAVNAVARDLLSADGCAPRLLILCEC